jgi:hypothetical protein
VAGGQPFELFFKSGDMNDVLKSLTMVDLSNKTGTGPSRVASSSWTIVPSCANGAASDRLHCQLTNPPFALSVSSRRGQSQGKRRVHVREGQGQEHHPVQLGHQHPRENQCAL